MVVHVRHPMAGQHVAIEGTEYARTSDLHGIAEVSWELREKGIELPYKVLGEHAVALKLKQKGPGMWAEVRLSIWCW